MKNMFKRGFKAVNEEKERQEEEKSKRGNLFRFFLTKDKEEADVTFLTEQPVNFYEHTLKKIVNGKERYESVPCIGEECTHCADGDRPSFKSAWLIIDHREVSYKDKEGKTKTLQDQVRLLVYGTKTASQLDRKSDKYGLTGRLYTIVRLGKGTSTSYTFEHGDKYELTSKEIEEVLPENLKQIYDGTMDSLYTIIEDEISKLAGLDEDTSKAPKEEVDETIKSVYDDEEEEKEDKPKSSIRRKIGKKNTEEKSVKPKKSIKDIMKSRKGN